MRKFRMTSNPLADVEPVGIRQHDVQQNQVRAFPPAQFDCAFSGLAPDERKPFFF